MKLVFKSRNELQNLSSTVITAGNIGRVEIESQDSPEEDRLKKFKKLSQEAQSRELERIQSHNLLKEDREKWELENKKLLKSKIPFATYEAGNQLIGNTGIPGTKLVVDCSIDGNSAKLVNSKGHQLCQTMGFKGVAGLMAFLQLHSITGPVLLGADHSEVEQPHKLTKSQQYDVYRLGI